MSTEADSKSEVLESWEEIDEVQVKFLHNEAFFFF